MVNSAFKSASFMVFAYFWLLAALVPAFAGGSRDRNLSRVDTLINEKQYNEAIRTLNLLVRRSPENFDIAHQRLQTIFEISHEFNRLANELIDTVLFQPDNTEKILALSRQIMEMDDESNPMLLAFVLEAREIAEFNAARIQLQEILARGRVLLDRGESTAALLTYAGGTNFLRDEFFTAGYGEVIENEVLQETERVNSVLGSFGRASADIRTLAYELANAINSSDIERAWQTISLLEPVMDRFIELKHDLYTSADSFDRILGELRVLEPEMGDRNHLSFFFRVIHGRQGEPIQSPPNTQGTSSASFQEGMLGVFDTYWETSVGQVITAIIQNAHNASSKAIEAFNAGDYPASIAALEKVEEYVNLSPLLFEKKLMLLNKDQQADRQAVLLFENLIHPGDILSYTALKSLSEAGNYLIQAAGAGGGMDTVANIDRSSAVITLDTERQIRDTIDSVSSVIENVIYGARQMDTLISYYNDTEYIKNALNAIEKFNSFVSAEKYQSANKYYTMANNELSGSLEERREELARGLGFLNGQRRENEAGTVVTDHYPFEALGIFNILIAELTENLEYGTSLLSRYGHEPAAVMEVREIAAMHAFSQAAVNELNSILVQSLVSAETARSRASLAETHRQEGERLFREAETAFQRQNFDAARDRLQRASERFVNSLEIQESSPLRESWDNQLISLGSSISAAENEMIIAEVRNLVNNAHTAYFAGNFQQAEENLTRARNRWRLTNTEDNEEVLYWLGIVRGAMSARSGRVIPPTAPLFPEMSQLLSEARRNYEEGILYINAGNRSQGLSKFDEARQQTREVRLMFPLNQEAGILELRMEQHTDPTAFSAAFEQRLRNAISGTQQRSIEAYADLQNLAEINPRYPGMAAIVTQAEINMGFRVPPPNPRDIARSRELTASASRIVDELNTAMYEVALTQINEAITLNPENSEAARVKDRLLTRMSVPGAIVLTSQDEDEYQRAVRELQAGNNLVALAVVERLMQNPRNRNIPKLVELQRRIQSIL